MEDICPDIKLIGQDLPDPVQRPEPPVVFPPEISAAGSFLICARTFHALCVQFKRDTVAGSPFQCPVKDVPHDSGGFLVDHDLMPVIWIFFIAIWDVPRIVLAVPLAGQKG